MFKFMKGQSEMLPPEGRISEPASSPSELATALAPAPAPAPPADSATAAPAVTPPVDESVAPSAIPAAPEPAAPSTNNDVIPPVAPVAEPRVLLTLGEAGEITSAQESCVAIFARESSALVGLNIRVLLRGGLDNEVGRLLHRHSAGREITEINPIQVIALRKDGLEFPVILTTLSWKSEAVLSDKPEPLRLTWAVEVKAVPGTLPPVLAAPAVDRVLPVSLPGAEPAPPAAESSRVPVTAAAAPEPIPVLPVNGDSAQVREHLRALEVEVARLRRDRDELANRLSAEQQAGAPSRRRIEELEKQLAAAAQSDKSAADLQAQLNAAHEAARRAETVLKEEVARKEKLEERLQTLTNSLRLEQAERSKRFEQEQVTLRQERDQLNSKLSSEQQAASESTRRAQELASLLERNAAEFARTKAELEQQAAERQKVESSFREQLDTAFVMKKELEGAWAGAVEKNKKVEEELALLRKEHDELQDHLKTEQQAAADSGKRAKEVAHSLGRNAAEFDRIKAELEKQAAEREQAEAEWREELRAAKSRKEKLEAAWTEAVERNRHLEDEASTFRRERDALKTEIKLERQQAADAGRQIEELQRRLDRQAAELHPIKSSLEKQQGDRDRAESKLRDQLESAKAEKQEVEAAWTAAVERNVQFEQELATLRRERDELNKRVSSERQRLESDYNQQLETARALSKKLEAAWTTAVERNKRIEAELASLRRERDDLKPSGPPRLAAKQRPEEAEPRPTPTTLRSDMAKVPTPRTPEPRPEPSPRKPYEPTKAPLRSAEKKVALPTTPPAPHPASAGASSATPPSAPGPTPTSSPVTTPAPVSKPSTPAPMSTAALGTPSTLPPAAPAATPASAPPVPRPAPSPPPSTPAAPASAEPAASADVEEVRSSSLRYKLG